MTVLHTIIVGTIIIDVNTSIKIKIVLIENVYLSVIHSSCQINKNRVMQVQVDYSDLIDL